MVMPERASSTITSSTSLIISGSSAEVGSSNSMMRGLMHRARAMATRCCWPPDSWPGYLLRLLGDVHALQVLRSAIFSASARGIFFTQTGPRQRLSSTVRCGNRLKLWNTMPTSARTLSIWRRSSVSSMPSTTMRPAWCVSSRLMQRIRVDLPEPEGPQMTIFSRWATVRLMFLRT